jgi:hypothetical protein
MSDYQLLKNNSASWMAIISPPFFGRIFLEYIDIVGTLIPRQTESNTLDLHDTGGCVAMRECRDKKKIMSLTMKV